MSAPGANEARIDDRFVELPYGPMPSIELKRRIRWADADAAGRLYYPRIFDYFGEAESELLRSLGVGLHKRYGGFDFPRIHVECQFRRVLALDDPFTLRVTVGRIGRTSIRYKFEVFAGENQGELAAEGSVTVVAVRDGQPVEVPAELRAALEDRPD